LYILIIIFNIVIGIIGNKNDLIDKKEVNEEIARDFAQDMGAFYLSTSALSSQGILEIFEKIGEKFLSGIE
jgi:predicted GTPase